MYLKLTGNNEPSFSHTSNEDFVRRLEICVPIVTVFKQRETMKQLYLLDFDLWLWLLELRRCVAASHFTGKNTVSVGPRQACVQSNAESISNGLEPHRQNQKPRDGGVLAPIVPVMTAQATHQPMLEDGLVVIYWTYNTTITTSVIQVPTNCIGS